MAAAHALTVEPFLCAIKNAFAESSDVIAPVLDVIVGVVPLTMAIRNANPPGKFANLVLSVLPLLLVELPIVGVGPASRPLPTSVHRKNQSSSGQNTRLYASPQFSCSTISAASW
jgi:hypothetical protein